MFAPARLRAGVRRCGATGAAPVSRTPDQHHCRAVRYALRDSICRSNSLTERRPRTIQPLPHSPHLCDGCLCPPPSCCLKKSHPLALFCHHCGRNGLCVSISQLLHSNGDRGIISDHFQPPPRVDGFWDRRLGVRGSSTRRFLKISGKVGDVFS